MIPTSIIDSLKSEKSVSGNPNWTDEGDAKLARFPLEVGSIGVQGLFVRVKIPNSVDAFGSLVQVEFENVSQVHNLERIDWKFGHTNPNVGPAELRLLSLQSTHYHAFDINFDHSKKVFYRNNIPIAKEVRPDPSTLQEFFEVCEEMLRVKGLARIARPPFQSLLF